MLGEDVGHRGCAVGLMESGVEKVRILKQKERINFTFQNKIEKRGKEKPSISHGNLLSANKHREETMSCPGGK